MSGPEQCFLSYSHADHAAFERLRVHLTGYTHLLNLRVWHDRRIQAGDYWNHRIEAEIERSQVFVLLATADFFASDYILTKEWPAIQARHRGSGALVMPVIYRRCGWMGFFGSYIQVVPTTHDGRLKPVADWPKPENGFAEAAKAISDGIQDWFGIKPRSPFAATARPTP
ncbi:toll/interleukin-1 receptor domain-containing protein [Falsiroseomonas ponticola]|uniref:toll/interleukin-1 receptor domain-containing protein n=1 Tax=Falsiroseomonas ponticola TaxID=2786951 RepID=UPI001934B164|nr:toll/interleukin-1 receptor domain-containing protein [Roseomonas ponticola]